MSRAVFRLFTREGWIFPCERRMGRYLLIAVDFGKDLSGNLKGFEASASYVEWAFTSKSLDLPNGGFHLPFAEDGPYHFEPPHSFPACKAATLKDAMDGFLSGPKEIFTKLHVNWGHASAQN